MIAPPRGIVFASLGKAAHRDARLPLSNARGGVAPGPAKGATEGRQVGIAATRGHFCDGSFRSQEHIARLFHSAPLEVAGRSRAECLLEDAQEVELRQTGLPGKFRERGPGLNPAL